MRNQDNHIEPRHQEGEIRPTGIKFIFLRESRKPEEEWNDIEDCLRIIFGENSNITQKKEKSWDITLKAPEDGDGAPYIH